MAEWWANDPIAKPEGGDWWKADPVSPQVSTAGDVAKQLAVGAGIGTLGLPGDIAHAINSGIDWGAGKLGLPVTPHTPFGTSDQIQRGLERVTGADLSPKTKAGEYARTGGEFLPAIVGGPETLLAKLGTRVALPAIASESAGQLTKGTAAEPYARVAGALAVPLGVGAARRVVTPLPATAERQALVNNLRNEGVDLTAGQASGSRPLQWAESAFGDIPGGGGRPAAMQARQAEQFTGAALRRAGETADRATPDVIDRAFTRIGNQFEQIAQRNNLVPDSRLSTDLVRTEREYNALVGASQRAPVIADTIRNVGDQIAANGGHLTGQQYNSMTSRLARQARGTADPQLQGALHDLRGALDDAMARSIARAGNTRDVAALREARNQYRNLMVIERAATGAGSNAAEGLVSPSHLRNATVAQSRRAYARGQGDFADLARSGEAIMKPLPQSGTAPRAHMQHLLSILGGAVGGASGGVPGALAGVAAPALAGRVLMSRPVQAYLGNQVLGAANPLQRQYQILNALAASQGGAPSPIPQAIPPFFAQ